MDEVDRVRLRGVWIGMLARCNDAKHRAYPWYGARGITVRFESLPTFRIWAESSGYRSGLWIDRNDADGDYSPENCRWITPKEQNRRRSNNRIIEAFGESLCMAAWVDDSRCTVSYAALKQRLDAGWHPERAITEATVLPSERDRCSRGHLFDEANTIIQVAGARRCRRCYNESRKERRRQARLRGEHPS